MRQAGSEQVSIFSLEPDDEQQSVFQAIASEGIGKTGIIIVFPYQHVQVFQSPKDFSDLKRYRRLQNNLPIFFVIPQSNQSARLARANGFPVYSSLEELKTPAETPAQMPVRHQEERQRQSRSTIVLKERQVPDPQTPIPEAFQSEYAEQSRANFDISGAHFLAGQPSSTLAQIDPQVQPGTADFLSQPVRNPQKNVQRPRHIALIAVLSVALILASVSAVLLFSQHGNTSLTLPVGGTIAGHLYFMSSGQVDPTGNIGENDIIEVSLSHVAAPAQGDKYYAWLLADSSQSDGPMILLGSLTVINGTGNLTYRDAQHADLLATYSRFLITEESGATQPTIPSPNQSTWRYNGGIPQNPNPNDTQNHYSLLNHLRHLLAAEPNLEKLGLHGGLTLWLVRNTEKLLQWTQSARDDWGQPGTAGAIRNQIIRTLDYLDGTSNVNRDVPEGTPVLVSQPQGTVGLIQIHAEQTPESMIQQIGFHLISLVEAPGITPAQKQMANSIDMVMNNILQCLQQARSDAKQIFAMTDNQLSSQSALSLLNDLVNQVNDAYTGTTNPATGATQQGVVWLQSNMYGLATINIDLIPAQ